MCVLLLRRCVLYTFFFFNDTATTEIYTLSLHDALPISRPSPSPQTSETASCTAAVPSAAVRSSPNRKSAGAAPATTAPEQSTDAPHPHTASQIAATSLSECRPPSPGSAATDDRSARASPAIHN